MRISAQWMWTSRVILLFADSIKQRVDQTFGPSVSVDTGPLTVTLSQPGKHTHPQIVSKKLLSSLTH